MNRMGVVLLALGCFLGFGPGNAHADLITFDGFTPGLPVPASYGGLTWNDKPTTYVVNSVLYGAAPVSPPNALFSPDGAIRITSAGPGTFTFVGAAFAGAGEDLSIRAIGGRNGVAVYTTSFTVRNGIFSVETLNFQNIDALAFLAVPLHPSGMPNDIPPFLIDNFRTGPETAPEPGSLLLFGIGLAGTGLAAVRGRRRKPSRD